MGANLLECPLRDSLFELLYVLPIFFNRVYKHRMLFLSPVAGLLSRRAAPKGARLEMLQLLLSLLDELFISLNLLKQNLLSLDLAIPAGT